MYVRGDLVFILGMQGEYEQEGVDITHVSYEDNRPLLELLLTVSIV